MNCKRAQKLISEYLDGTLDERRATQLKEHMAGCRDCRETYEDFKGIVKEARNLKTVTPPDTAWEKISGTLAGARLVDSRKLDPTIRPSHARPFFAVPRAAWLSAAAAVLVVAVGGLALLRPWQGRAPLGPAADQFTLAKLEEAKDFYRKAINSLTEASQAQSGTLDPRAAKAFRKNLGMVDASIESCQAAVRRNPRSLENQDFLLAAYRDKVEILTELISLKRKSGAVPVGTVAF
ncbi:MAG: hypothetical protein A2Y56_15870 [Candidatus Aminicenantes bacterium RBG_13_63_10]|nr:MAG: hypothetical protein A2Y56_15870 [Candidatus Aminicenantes bacterium RBG_13_63_10]